MLWFMQWRYNTLVFYIFQSRVLLTSFCLEPAQTSFLMAYYCLPMDVVSPDVPPVQVLQFRATTTRVPQTIPSRFSPLLWGRDRDPCLLSALFWCIPEPPCGSLSPLCCSMRSLAALPHLSLSSLLAVPLVPLLDGDLGDCRPSLTSGPELQMLSDCIPKHHDRS